MIITGIPQPFYNKFIGYFNTDTQNLIHRIRYYKWKKINFPKFLSVKTNMPVQIEIETINRCNATCPFCPTNKHADIRDFKMMDKALFLDIINQLKKIDYRGAIALFSNNEPFLDERIIDFIKIAKEALPKASHYLYTNGSLLTIDKFIVVIDLLDKLFIDNYNDQLILNKKIAAIHEYCKMNPEIDKKVVIMLRKQNEVLTSRGGFAPNKQGVKPAKLSCLLPFRQLIIRPDGKLSLCCNDVYGKYTMGDLTNQNIIEAWNSDFYKEIRTKFMKTNRLNMEMCCHCDTTLFL